jgi:NAD(P)H-flavin reductase
MADLSYTDKFESWEAAGFEVVPVISRPELDQVETKRVLGGEQGKRTGYVQNALEEDGVSIPRNSGALLCGVKGMVDSARSLLLKAGVFEGRVMTNF